MKGYVDIVRTLLECGAYVEVQNNVRNQNNDEDYDNDYNNISNYDDDDDKVHIMFKC